MKLLVMTQVFSEKLLEPFDENYKNIKKDIRDVARDTRYLFFMVEENNTFQNIVQT